MFSELASFLFGGSGLGAMTHGCNLSLGRLKKEHYIRIEELLCVESLGKLDCLNLWFCLIKNRLGGRAQW